MLRVDSVAGIGALITNGRLHRGKLSGWGIQGICTSSLLRHWGSGRSWLQRTFSSAQSCTDSQNGKKIYQAAAEKMKRKQQ